MLDRDGNPLRGLTANDFQVFEDGQPQRITNFSIVENGAVTVSSGASTPSKEPERLRRRVLVVLATGLLSKPRVSLLMDRLRQFIDDHFEGDYEWSIAFALGRSDRPAVYQ